MVTFKQMAPSLLTMGSLFCGLLSAVYTLGGGEAGFVVAAWWILAAALFDALDGKCSRLFKTASKFGVELDSIADVCSFGFAPAILIYSYTNMYAPALEALAFPIAFLFLACGALRLARFNVELTGFDKNMFKGMPIPSAAGIVAAFVVFSQSEYLVAYSFEWVFPFLAAGMALLMVSSVKYDTFPRFSFDDARNRIKLLILLTWGLFAVFFPAEAFLPLGIIYVLSGFVRGLLSFVRSEEPVALEEPVEHTESGRL